MSAYDPKRPSQSLRSTSVARGMRRRPPALTSSPDITEGNQPPASLIPQHKPNAAKALKQREPADATQIGIVPKRLWQPVVGYTATQMVDMVHANVRREPAQNSRQVVMRTSTKRRLVKTPFPAMRPERLFELMLQVK